VPHLCIITELFLRKISNLAAESIIASLSCRWPKDDAQAAFFYRFFEGFAAAETGSFIHGSRVRIEVARAVFDLGKVISISCSSRKKRFVGDRLLPANPTPDN